VQLIRGKKSQHITLYSPEKNLDILNGKLTKTFTSIYICYKSTDFNKYEEISRHIFQRKDEKGP